MSHVDYKNWECLPVEFMKVPSHPVDFKKGCVALLILRKCHVSCHQGLMRAMSLGRF